MHSEFDEQPTTVMNTVDSSNGNDLPTEHYEEIMFVRRLIEQSLVIFDLEVFEKGSHPIDAACRAASILDNYLDANG